MYKEYAAAVVKGSGCALIVRRIASESFQQLQNFTPLLPFVPRRAQCPAGPLLARGPECLTWQKGERVRRLHHHPSIGFVPPFLWLI